MGGLYFIWPIFLDLCIPHILSLYKRIIESKKIIYEGNQGKKNPKFINVFFVVSIDSLYLFLLLCPLHHPLFGGGARGGASAALCRLLPPSVVGVQVKVWSVAKVNMLSQGFHSNLHLKKCKSLTLFSSSFFSFDSIFFGSLTHKTLISFEKYGLYRLANYSLISVFQNMSVWPVF